MATQKRPTRTSFSEPPAHRFELRYKKGWKTVTIWPDTLGIHVKNSVALFSGYAASRQPDPNNLQDTDLRLFAVNAPDLPLDITDEVLSRWTNKTNTDVVKVFRTASYFKTKHTENGLEFIFATDGPGIHVLVNWDQISDIMREVKEKGVVRKDRVWGTSYIEKEFKPETTDK